MINDESAIRVITRLKLASSPSLIFYQNRAAVVEQRQHHWRFYAFIFGFNVIDSSLKFDVCIESGSHSGCK